MEIWNFHKFSKKYFFMPKKQGLIFHGKWWNSSISLKLGEIHQILPNSMEFGEFHGISPFGELTHFRRPPSECFKNQWEINGFQGNFAWNHQILVISPNSRDSPRHLGPDCADPDAREFAKSAKKCYFHQKREMGGNRPESPEFGEITKIWWFHAKWPRKPLISYWFLKHSTAGRRNCVFPPKLWNSMKSTKFHEIWWNLVNST